MADHLDLRQRAMLAEMGVQVLQRLDLARVEAELPQPNTQAEAETEAVKVPPARAVHSGVPLAPPRDIAKPPFQTPAQPHPGPLRALEAQDWSQLKATAANCQDCGLCRTRQASVWGQSFGPQPSPEAGGRPLVLVITDPPDDADEASGQVLGGEQAPAWQLLTAMLQAAGWTEGNTPGGVFLTAATKCKVPRGYKLTETEILACQRYLIEQIRLLQPQLILTMGRVAAQALLAPALSDNSATFSLGQVRGSVHTLQGGNALVASLAPQYLLRNPLEKAKAWEDICLALQHLAQTPAPGALT